MVDVACLGVAAIGAPDIIGTLLRAEFGQPVTPAIVEHPYLKLRVVNSQGGEDGPMKHVRALVVSRDEDVDAGELVNRPLPQCGLVTIGFARAVLPPTKHQVEDRIIDEGDSSTT